MKIGCEILLLLHLWELTPLRIDWLRKNKNPKTLVSSHKPKETNLKKLGWNFHKAIYKLKPIVSQKKKKN